jgi:hypothetical protein
MKLGKMKQAKSRTRRRKKVDTTEEQEAKEYDNIEEDLGKEEEAELLEEESED